MKAHSPSRQHEQTKKTFDFLPGPVKIKDALFLGDQLAARDIEFIISNKVTHVINTVSKQVPNLWQRFGIHYLSVNWTEKEQNIFDKKNNAVNTVFQFIEQAMEAGESCLIHSMYGKSRSCCVLVAYLMKKYSWSLNKCLEYICSKKENLQIRKNFIRQIEELEERFSQKNTLTNDWKQYNAQNQEQLVLKNTLMNTKTQHQKIEPLHEHKKNAKRISFEEKPIIHKLTKTTQKQIANNAPNKNIKPTKSILKGFPSEKDDIRNSEKTEFLQFDEDNIMKEKKTGSITNNINGNVVHVTVNNFIASDKKVSNGKNSVNYRPFSSDQKQKERKPLNNPKKTILNDPMPFGASLKSPYDIKNGQKHSKPGQISKKQTAVRYQPNERPQSAKHRTPIEQNIRKDMFGTFNNSNGINMRKKNEEQLFRRR